jgi:hypothetical protein
MFYPELVAELCYFCSQDLTIVNGLKQKLDSLTLLKKFIGSEVNLIDTCELIPSTLKLTNVNPSIVTLETCNYVTHIPLREIRRYAITNSAALTIFV